MIWTTARVKVSENSYHTSALVDILDKRPYRYSRASAIEMPISYGELLGDKTEFAILFPGDKCTAIDDVMLGWLAEMFVNGLVALLEVDKTHYYPHVRETQIHVYPLVMLAWFGKKYRDEQVGWEPKMFVDGKIVSYTKDYCCNCPAVLERAVSQCHVAHASCKHPLIGINDPNVDWLLEHQTNFEKMRESPDHEYRNVKDMSDLDPFEAYSILQLTTNKTKVEEARDRRVYTASAAAKTRLLRSRACVQCAVKNHCRRVWSGDDGCKGLVLKSDFDFLSDKCEPWMAHALSLAGKTINDLSSITSWKKARTGAYVLRPASGVCTQYEEAWSDKYDGDARSVMVMRPILGNPSMRMPYLYLCKMLNVEPVETWSQLDDKFVKSKAFRTIAFGFAEGIISSYVTMKGGWSSRSVELTEIKVSETAETVRLIYRNKQQGNRTEWFLTNDRYFTELMELPGVSPHTAVFTPERQKENDVLFHSIQDLRLNLLLEDVRTGLKQKFKSDEELDKWLINRSKERCSERRRIFQQKKNLNAGDPSTAK